MAILSVTPDDIEFFTTLINPSRFYSSSSSGVTGSLNLFARASHVEKEPRPLTNFSASFANDRDIESLRNAVVLKARNTAESGSFKTSLEEYLSEINSQSVSVRKQKEINVLRFTPSTSFTSNTIRKLNVKDMLMSYYKANYPTAQWTYTNYNSLNFFTSPNVPTSSVLLYPNIENSSLPVHDGYVSGTYALSGGFSFDFHINPRHKDDGMTPKQFKAGTIFHLSSSYALSLITGSRKDVNGYPVSYRLLLQLSHSADIPPSKAIPGSYPNNLIFLSDDNSLDWNNWHRIVVRWGTNLVNDGTGSFNINGIDKGTFVIPSGTIMPRAFGATSGSHALCVGNFFEGVNTGSANQSYFFTDVSSTRDGIEKIIETGGTADAPSSYAFNHPLNAEIHGITIRRKYLTDVEIQQTSGSGPSTINPLDIAFHVPPLFVDTTAIRKFVNGAGGILQTPFFEIDGSTDDPFNVAMAYGVNGHYINLENFVKDFANNVFPRLHHMSGTALTYTTEAKEANEFLYSDPYVRRRNLLVMPCDDGTYAPNYNLVADQIGNKYVDTFGRYNPSVINLDNLLSTASLLFGQTYNSDDNAALLEQQIGFTPENPGLPPGSAVLNQKAQIENTISTNESAYDPGVQRGVPLTIYQRTKDPSSNQVTFFDISNLYYGSRIVPGSFSLVDSSLSGSGGRISITLKDDGYGNLYRADSLSPQSTWNSVGNIFYNEGVVLVKSPHLYFFGKDGYEMTFKGEQQLHSSKFEILAPSGMINSSSNPSYARVENVISASADPLDKKKFVYISNINFHDENLNVVAKAVLAQPVIKREDEKILFKVAFDF